MICEQHIEESSRPQRRGFACRFDRLKALSLSKGEDRALPTGTRNFVTSPAFAVRASTPPTKLSALPPQVSALRSQLSALLTNELEPTKA
ncbi:Unannotated [Lentimonas sp. CC4]|nr:Unannotated [Lentimonas sp. CC4]CAA6686586.1 Unannotated [Lentimonas sp. CC6]CAA7074862.1 Unannotated [Lentimonas sp. CC4]CAA7179760.1 Unannotated [Lentimonas sp. CC8]